MRRIYESGAVDRDDEDPYRPGEDGVKEHPRAMRTVSGATLSRWLVPHWLRYRALSVSLSTPRTEYAVGERVPFAVTVRNRYPFPVAVPTPSPMLWRWSVDGLEGASELPRELPERREEFEVRRGQRKRYTRSWSGLFKTSPTEWTEAEPGEYTIRAWLNVDLEDLDGRGLADEVTVRVSP